MAVLFIMAMLSINVNPGLLRKGGILEADIHTVNAQNKQTVARVASLYRKLGLRCAGIVDFDVLNEASSRPNWML